LDLFYLGIALPVFGSFMLFIRLIYLLRQRRNSYWELFPEFDQLASSMNVKMAIESRRWEMTRIPGIAQTNPVRRSIMIDSKVFSKLDANTKKAVIAHELAHLKLRHSTKSYSLLIGGTVISLVTSITGSLILPSFIWLIFFFATLVLRRNYEYQADFFSVKFVDARYLVELLKRARDSSGDTVASRITHPSAESRIEKLETYTSSHS